MAKASRYTFPVVKNPPATQGPKFANLWPTTSGAQPMLSQVVTKSDKRYGVKK